MINIAITDQTSLIAFWLIFSRWLAIMFQLPLFDNMTIPTMVKVLSTLLISYAFFPITAPHVIKDIQYLGVENFWALTIFYTFVGLIIGYFVKAIMNIFIASGSMITQSIGFAAVRYFDPSSSSQVGPFERLIQWTILIMVITSGALIPMFKGVLASFEAIHVYQLGKMANISIFFLEFFKSIFTASLMLASPILFTHVMIMAVLGIISRTVPQMNIIMVSFVVNIGMGLLVFIACSDEFFQVAYKMYTDRLGEWFLFFS